MGHAGHTMVGHVCQTCTEGHYAARDQVSMSVDAQQLNAAVAELDRRRKVTEEPVQWGILTDYATGSPIRPASREEWEKSQRSGVFGVWNHPELGGVYVSGGPESDPEPEPGEEHSLSSIRATVWSEYVETFRKPSRLNMSMSERDYLYGQRSALGRVLWLIDRPTGLSQEEYTELTGTAAYEAAMSE